jgi:hypothetical protein
VGQSSAISIITQYVPVEYLVYVVFSVVALIIFLFVMLVMYKLRSGRESSAQVGLAFDDISRLKEKGLLTEEELKQVRAAMARRLTDQLKTKAPAAKPETLLFDPEVMALEEKARAKEQAKADIPPLDAPQPPSPPAPSPGEEPEVPLPPEIEALAAKGLITQEELETIRKRAAARGRAGT